MHSPDFKVVLATIKIRVEAAMIMDPGSLRTTTTGITPIPPIAQLSIPPGAMPTIRRRMTRLGTHLWLRTSKQRRA